MSHNNKLLPWLLKDWALLHGYIKQNRIPQALLVSGMTGIGKAQLARQFANALLCRHPDAKGFSCGACQGCLLVNAGTHPDFSIIRPEEEKKTISINQIRTVITDAYLKPQYDTYRIVLIEPADALTLPAANAFLKCLEEPNERTLFILVTSKPDKLPATIISRCQKLTIHFPDSSTLSNWLQGQGIHKEHETLIQLAKGAMLNLQQIDQDEILKQRKECFNDWLAIAAKKNYPTLVSEKWLKLPELTVMNWLISWVSDLVKSRFLNNRAYLYNPDLAAPLQELSQQLDLKRLFGFYDNLLSSRSLLVTQLNYQMMVEDILVQWQNINRRM